MKNKGAATTAASPNETVEKRALEILRQKIKDRKMRPGEIAKALEPPLSESQLRHLLNGGSACTLDRFFQIAKLVQMDPLEVLHSANPDPKFEQPFNHEQEVFLVADVWRYRIMKALSLPRTERELIQLFPECSQISLILKALIEHKIAIQLNTEKETVYRLNASAFQLTTVDFVEGFTELLLKNVEDIHETTVEIDAHRRDLIKYIRNMMVVDYLTPDQMMTLRDRLLSVFAEFRRFVGTNRMDSTYGAVAKKNLVCLVTLMAPLNRSTFLKGSKG